MGHRPRTKTATQIVAEHADGRALEFGSRTAIASAAPGDELVGAAVGVSVGVGVSVNVGITNLTLDGGAAFTNHVAGKVTAAAAEVTGLAEGTPVAAGMFDIDACGLAVGMTDESTLCMVAGTWGNNQ